MNVSTARLTHDAARWLRVAGLALAVLCVLPTGSHAVESLGELLGGPMDDAALKGAFSGRSLEGVYSDATAWSEAYGADGRLFYRDRNGQSPGDWSVRNDRFCTFYPASGELTGGCFLVARRGDNCFDFYSVGPASEPGVSSEDLRTGLNWTARGWYVEAEPTCPEDKRQIVERKPAGWLRQPETREGGRPLDRPPSYSISRSLFLDAARLALWHAT